MVSPRWELVSQSPGGSVAGLATTTQADGSTHVLAATRAGVFRSTDVGLTWSPTTASETVAIGEGIAASKGVLLVGGSNGVYCSDDGGATWMRTLVGAR